MNPHNEAGRPKVVTQYKWTYFESKQGVTVLTLPSLYCFSDKQRGILEEILCNLLHQNSQ